MSVSFKTGLRLSLLVWGLVSCASVEIVKDVPVVLSPASESAFKGYEFYSWQTNSNQWAYALMPGTNALKTNNTIAANQQSHDQMIVMLRALPLGSHLSWNPSHNTQGSKTLDFGLPDASQSAEIRKVMAERELIVAEPAVSETK